MTEEAVVKIYATTQDPDYDSPWHARSPSASTGSGVVVGKDLILTGAHVVANSTFIQVQKSEDPRKAIAEVCSISHDCDLALLRVTEEGFLKGSTPPKIGGLPSLRDRVSVVGFPIGGDEVSITEGVVSRVEVQRYSHSQRELLAVTVDAAINKGNSGGPVFKDGEIVGIAFQKLDDADGIGEMVPAPIIKHFLKLAPKFPRVRIPTLGISTQGLENRAQRQKLGLQEHETGVLCLTVDYNGSCWGVLQRHDVILEADGYPVANNATLHYRQRYRTRFDALLGEKHIGEAIKLKILRHGKRLDLSVQLKSKSYLVPDSQYEQTPNYYIFGGLVFQPLSRDYLEVWNNWTTQAPDEFLHLYWSGYPTTEQQEVIVISQILADQINIGYENRYNETVKTINGVLPKTLEHLIELIESSKTYVTIETSQDGHLVFDIDEAVGAQRRILERYKIPADRTGSSPTS